MWNDNLNHVIGYSCIISKALIQFNAQIYTFLNEILIRQIANEWDAMVITEVHSTFPKHLNIISDIK